MQISKGKHGEQEGLLQSIVCKSRIKQRKGRNKRSRQENWSYSGNILPKDGYNKDINCKDLVDTKEIKKRWEKIHGRTV